MFHSAGPILTLLLPLVLSTPLPLAQDAQDTSFIPFLPLASRDTYDAAHSFWIPRSKLDQMERRSIQSHRFRDTDGTSKRVETTASGRSTSLGGTQLSHRRFSPRNSSPNVDAVRGPAERDILLVQRQDQTLGDFVDAGSSDLAGAKVLFATIITQAGAQATGVSGGAEWSMMVEVIPSSSETQTSAGTITESCLTMVSDPSQKFCETVLDGQVIGSDAGIAQAPPVASGAATSSTPVVVDAPGNDTATAAAAVTDSASSDPSASAGGGGTSASESIGAVVNTADPTDNVSSSPSSSAALDPSASGADTQITGSPVVVNDPTSPAGSSSSSSSAAVTEAPVVVNDPAAASGSPSGTLSPTAIMLNAPTSGASPSGSDTALGGTAAPVVVNAPPLTSSAAAAAAQENNAATTIPGQKMQVLPIGLGILGGLAGITLLVVGYVYWERRKYKRQFRTRKAAEKSLMDRAVPMGSGGYGAA